MDDSPTLAPKIQRMKHYKTTCDFQFRRPTIPELSEATEATAEGFIVTLGVRSATLQSAQSNQVQLSPWSARRYSKISSQAMSCMALQAMPLQVCTIPPERSTTRTRRVQDRGGDSGSSSGTRIVGYAVSMRRSGSGDPDALSALHRRHLCQ